MENSNRLSVYFSASQLSTQELYSIKGGNNGHIDPTKDKRHNRDNKNYNTNSSASG